jgi:hypothetical protein
MSGMYEPMYVLEKSGVINVENSIFATYKIVENVAAAIS